MEKLLNLKNELSFGTADVNTEESTNPSVLKDNPVSEMEFTDEDSSFALVEKFIRFVI